MLVQQSEATANRRQFTFMVQSPISNGTVAGLSFAAADIQVSKADGAEGNSAGTVTELAGGLYRYEATAGEVDTVGALSLRIAHTSARPDVVMAQVVPWDVYAANLPADVLAINSDTSAAVQLAAHAVLAVPVTFSATSATTTTGTFVNVDGSAASAVDDYYMRRVSTLR